MAALEGWGVLSPGFQLSAKLLAAGSRAHAGRYLFYGQAEQGVEWEIEMVVLTVVEGGQSQHVELFPGDDADSALARFEEVGAQTEPERALIRLCRSVNSRDWDVVEDLYTEDYERIDRRMLGWESTRGGRPLADFFRSWVGVVPDIEMRFTVLAGDDEHAVVRYVGWGHAAEGGGEMEYPFTQCYSIRDGRFRRGEIFEAEDEALALARFEELRADRR